MSKEMAGVLRDALIMDAPLGGVVGVVEMLSSIGTNQRRIADAIMDSRALPGRDASGGHVSCLTEAVMGSTAGLHAIASALMEIAEAIRESK